MLIWKGAKPLSTQLSYDSAFSASLALHFNACQRTALVRLITLFWLIWKGTESRPTRLYEKSFSDFLYKSVRQILGLGISQFFI